MAQQLLIIAGRFGNHAERGTLSSTSASVLFPLSRLADGRPMQDFRFSAAGTDDSITLDGDILKGAGAFEAGISSSWAGSGGTWAVDSVVKDSGTQSAKLAHSASTSRTFDFYARSGEAFSKAWAIRGDGTATAKIYLRNTRTGRYLKSDGTWTSTRTALDTQTTAAWQSGSITATVEAFTTALVPWVVMRWECELSASGSAWFDSTYIWPSWDFVSIHGHNLGPVTCELRSSTDGFSGSDTLEKTVTVATPRFWARLDTPSTRRYRRIKFVGTNHEPISLGEWVTGLAYATGKIHEWGYELRETYPDVSLAMPDGALHVANVAPWPRLAFGAKFQRTDAQAEEAEREIFGRCQGRAYPLVIVPDDSKPAALFGRLGQTWATARAFFNDYSQDDFVVNEEPFPRATY